MTRAKHELFRELVRSDCYIDYFYLVGPRNTNTKQTSGNLQEIFPYGVFLEADALAQRFANLVLEISSLCVFV